MFFDSDMRHPAALTLSGVSKIYPHPAGPVTALTDVSLSVEPGEVVVLSGPSGSGKSTLLNIAGLTEAPSDGSVFLNGAAVPFTDENFLTKLRRTSLGFVFQYFNLLPSLTAWENVAVSLLLNGRPWDEAKMRAAEALDAVGLRSRGDHYPRQLSGGEMQRVAICRAFVHSPPVILADEPTGNLDSGNGSIVISLLRERARAGAAVVIASHSEEVSATANRVIRLRDGRVVG